MKRFVRVMWIRGVKIQIHWTVLVVSAVLAAGSVARPVLGAVALLCFLGTIAIHEVGHVLMAQRCGVPVLGVEVYPVFGVTWTQQPSNYYHTCLIAWGGVLAQLVVATPLVAWVVAFGYTRVQALNAALALLGFYNASVAAFNLLPIHPLDGCTAWDLLPMLARRERRSSSTPRVRRGGLRVVK